MLIGNFFGLDIFLGNKFFWTEIFWVKKEFWSEIFVGQKKSGSKNFLGRKFIWVKNLGRTFGLAKFYLFGLFYVAEYCKVEQQQHRLCVVVGGLEPII